MLTSTGLPLLSSAGLIASRPALAGDDGTPPKPVPGGLSFGALTLANAGGIAKPTGATRITGGTATGYAVADGLVVPSSNGSATSGTIRFDDGTSWDVTAAANEYSVRTVSEMVAVNALGPTALGGKTMRLRPGTYDVVNTAWLGNRSFPSTFTIASHDTPAFPGIGGTSHARVKIITHRDKIANNYSGMARIVFDGLCIEGRFDRNDTTARQYVMDGGGGSLTDVVWQRCWLKGDDDVIGAEGTYDGFLGRYDDGFKGSTGVAFRHCKISDMHRLFTINRPGRREITHCQLQNYALDAAVVGWSGEIVFTDNLIFSPSGDRSFVTWRKAKASRDGAITGMADSTKGLFVARIGNGAAGVRQVLWSMQALGGTPYAQLEWTSGDKLYFWAADSAGVKRVELTSTLSPRDNFFYNVLVSVDNGAGGTSKMLVWESAAKQGAAPVTDIVTQTGTGQALRWNAGGMSIGADNGSGGGGAHFDGSAGRFLFHPGIAPDVEDARIQAVFFDAGIASGPVVEDYATLGRPVIDVKPSLSQWRNSADTGAALNDGTGQGLVLRTGRTSVEAGHVDGLQAITNPAGQQDGGGPIRIERNVMFGHPMNGVDVSAPGGQGFFFEDIQQSWVHDRPYVRNNLLLFGGPHGISFYNPHLAKIFHNTLATTGDMLAGFSHLIKIRLGLHNTGTASQRSKDLANGCMRSNIAHGFVLDSGIDAHIASPDAHPVLMDNAQLPDFEGKTTLGDYFAGTSGDGTGFDWSDLVSIEALKAMFATNPALNPPGVVRIGWDAYWNEPSPWEGSCAAFTVPDRAGAGESAFVTPASVSAGGIAVHTGGALDCRLYAADGTPVSDWTRRPLHLSAGQKFKVRRTSGTGSATVYAGDKTDIWMVS